MTAPRIVEGSAAYIDRIMPVMRAAFDPRFGEAWNAAQCLGILAIPGTTLRIAESGTRAIGFALMRTIMFESELLLIAIDPDYRRQGIGRQLVRSSCEVARSSGAEAIFLEVRDSNDAILLYEGVGFVQVGRRARYYRGIDGAFYDALTFRLDL
jgi:[ribosomal protein S18]-alanine N-acetyltransferase